MIQHYYLLWLSFLHQSCKDTVKRLEAKLKQATSDATMHEHEFDKAQTTISELQEKIKTQQVCYLNTYAFEPHWML